MLSQTAEHALRALLYIARQPESVLVPANRIAEATGAPPRYLAKTLQGLAAAGLLRASRGREGGYALRVPAASITVGDVMAAFDTESRDGRCLLGDASCTSERPCAAHLRWREAQQTALTAVSGVRIEDLLTGAATLEQARDESEAAALRAAS